MDQSPTITINLPILEELLNRVKKLEKLVSSQKQDPLHVYTKQEVCKLLSISYCTLLRRVKNGAIQTTPDGGITRRSIEKYINLE